MKTTKTVLTGQKGFTLIEILLVVMIIGALAVMVVPRLTGRGERALVTVAQVDISANIASALKLYELDNGTFPTTSQGLEALLEKPTAPPAPRNWNGPYLEKKPVDPWGQPYQYASPGTHGNGPYDLYSYGPDKTNPDAWIANWK